MIYAIHYKKAKTFIILKKNKRFIILLKKDQITNLNKNKIIIIFRTINNNNKFNKTNK